MVIERTINEFIIRIPFMTSAEKTQDLIDYLRYKELTAVSDAKQSEVDFLAREINKNWWNKNKDQF